MKFSTNPDEYELKEKRNKRNIEKQKADRLYIEELLKNDAEKTIPAGISRSFKNELVRNMRSRLSIEALLQCACMICDLLHKREEGKWYAIDGLDEKFITKLNNEVRSSEYLEHLPDILISQYDVSSTMVENGVDEVTSKKFSQMLLSPRGIHGSKCFICHTCHYGITRKRHLKLSIANGNAIRLLQNQ